MDFDSYSLSIIPGGRDIVTSLHTAIYGSYALGYGYVFYREPEFQWLTTIFKFPVALYGHHLTV